jgi:hypothetical protein
MWRYCGTFDRDADVARPDTGTPERVLIDWKTAASGIWPDTAFQLAAYRWAETYVDTDGAEKPMADLGITRSYGVHLRADGYDAIPLDTSEQVFKDFLHIAWVARHCCGDPVKALVGPAVQPAAIEETP